jgi:hypothetical protein
MTDWYTLRRFVALMERAIACARRGDFLDRTRSAAQLECFHMLEVDLTLCLADPKTASISRLLSPPRRSTAMTFKSLLSKSTRIDGQPPYLQHR